MTSSNAGGPTELADLVAELRSELQDMRTRIEALEDAESSRAASTGEQLGLRRELRDLRSKVNRLERESRRSRELFTGEIRAIWRHPAIRRLVRLNPLGLKLLGLLGLFGAKDAAGPAQAGSSMSAEGRPSAAAADGPPGKTPRPDDSALREEAETYLRGFCALTNTRRASKLTEVHEGRIVVDASRLFSKHLTGVGYYCEHLTRALLRRHSGEIVAYASAPVPAWVLEYAGRPDFVHMPAAWAVNDFSRRAEAPRLEAIAGPYDAYFHTSTSYWPLIQADPMLAVIYDLAPLACPETVPEAVSEACGAYNRYLAESARRFVAISEYTKQSFVECTGVDPERVEVISVGMDPLFRAPVLERDRARVAAKYGLEEPYMLCVGTLQPRKNLLRLIQAYSDLESKGLRIPRLLLVGTEQWAKMEGFTKSLERLRDNRSIAFTGYVERADLPALYGGCQAFVYPSYFEGYGMPVAEAMACGAPVICGDRTSLPEVAGDAAVYCDPLSVDSITNAMETTLRSPARIESLRARSAERAESFPTWDEVADKFLAEYEKVRHPDAR